ncbi:tyrosine-type recombinase/integrase [Candidatus Woesearchaeota archaeon]|nr:tyrosine-type recombinase/integrase [Candidatus Woesearchaeota archaeon]
MVRRRYSPKTVLVYVDSARKFFRWVGKEPKRVTKNDIREYLQELALRDLSSSTLNLHLQAIKWVLENVLNKRKYFVTLPYSRKEKRLPLVLSRDEVRRLFDAVRNEKHRLMVKLMYSAGLRVSELLNLRVDDLDLENYCGWVRKGKGGKDRLFVVAQALLDDLRMHVFLEGLQNEDYLFKGRFGSYSPRTVAEILKSACLRAGIRKKVHPHTLRHSFATHLIEDGVPLIVVQSLLGHASPNTSMVYVHASNPARLDVRSPLDAL